MSDETKKANSEQPEHNEKLPPPLTAGQPTAEPEVAGRAGSIANDGGQTGDRSSAATAPAASQPAGPELTPPVNPDVAAAETPAPASLEVVAGPEGAEAPSVAASSQSQGDLSPAATAPAAAASQPAGPKPPVPEDPAVGQFRKQLVAWVSGRMYLPQLTAEMVGTKTEAIIKIPMCDSVRVALAITGQELNALAILIGVYYRDWRVLGLSESECATYFEQGLLEQIYLAVGPADRPVIKKTIWEFLEKLQKNEKWPPLPQKSFGKKIAPSLTPKQAKAAELYAHGASGAEACRGAGYSESTATKQQARILGKLEVILSVSEIRAQLRTQLEQQGMTPERVAATLVKQMEAKPLQAIALWSRLVGLHKPF